MSIRFGSKIAGTTLAATVALAFLAPVAQATPVTYDFSVTAGANNSGTSGPLGNSNYMGSFSIDSSLITPNAFINVPPAVSGTSFTFAFDGTTFTEQDISFGSTTGLISANWGFGANGDLTSFDAEGLCAKAGAGSPGAACLPSLQNDGFDGAVWTIGWSSLPPFNSFNSTGFSYGPDSNQYDYNGPVTVSLASSLHAVPEPGVLGIFGLGLVVLGVSVVAKRRKDLQLTA